MKNLLNIDKSAFRPGQYVGYANGAWRISRSGKRWQAIHQKSGEYMFANTLTAISQALAEKAK